MTTTLSALTFTSDDPAQLAAFYRDAIGIPFALNQHGTTHPHQECDLHGIHFAILPSVPNLGGPVTPVFRVNDLEAALATATSAGAALRIKPFSLGKGMPVAGFADPDGNTFRLIEIAGLPLIE